MSKPTKLQRQEHINYKAIIKHHPWVAEKNHACILSPDSDGFLCGLLMTNQLGWGVAGYYDGKFLVIKKSSRAEDCVFLDIDINRSSVKSVGHHIVTYNKTLDIPNFNYSSCIQPNIVRSFDSKQNFQQKYPFGTTHLLLGILQEAGVIKRLPKDAVWPLLFADGVWNNLFGYTENCLDWIRYLLIDRPNHILNPLFCSNDQSFYEIMLGLNEFLRMRDKFNAEGYYKEGEYRPGGRNKRTGDKLKISDNKGVPINLVRSNNNFTIHHNEKGRLESFISSMANSIEWKYIPKKWAWENLRVCKFSRSDFSKKKLNNRTYIGLMRKNPLSLAITSGQNLEYTLETPDRLK